ncbi:DNA polymerase IV [Ponticoccus sp. SC2-23]|uniref:DNA polymerase IV n=1 Tax=Alexandriicola marinus TaxID=2081710 RepID=UPI000FD80D86|nr:DNA polymerase IV [Alexandriicola marinus]MBM1220458.1 DNA polymerase IV [Ponticoccus sp. SC6-9]MBM1225144.1 DNA polymerase IV [Ponticoccus sp. SC6-15]MBM1228658.1 DNA polymerase IV [Ponticoccus sp. SC6-38]MBM1233705.1 DNA polymerase IV [Ponticoccus sp. SC6-45]MBM1239159.1 DNA polymerase IV [Ponticoccus sp. SC6-49]MBM1242941.1 DNA polymerase IV [Ponticoccus sp. SC2-64]MBM1247229.1 DNA polymerase IV [Ponticoccus sp. SC6-42]MBM1252112.1 DNA polymerase IV [Ponticoccus sp. SC6-33]MBM1257168
MPSLCRDCLTMFEGPGRCPACRRPRVVTHPELFDLTIAHMDCDAFFASVEKRDNPELADKPVIVGGGKRGVVSTACYLARIKGVRSAMPMFKALQLCPDAVVVRPRGDAYAAASRAIRAMMDELTPVVEPLSLDEAFMDLSGTQRLHGAPPAVMLAKLVKRMKDELGLTGSIGLSHNKFLAKVASDLEKPRGFSVIGRAETVDFLRPRPVGLIWGIGPAAQESLDKAGIRTFEDLHRWEKQDLEDRFGGMGTRLWHLARGEDARRVSANAPIKGISNETTFHEDTSDPDILDGHIWRMAEKVSGRAKAKDTAGRIVTLKLKRANHKQITRRHSLHHPTQVADTIYRTARALFDQVEQGQAYRLLGVGLSELSPASEADREGDLLDPDAAKRAEAERATDRIRARFGSDAIMKGRALR